MAKDAFDEWLPRDYLRDYYSELQEDERYTIRYFVEQMRAAPEGPLVCFGSGPTLHHVFLTAGRATELYLADYLTRNLDEIERWLTRAPGAHDWVPFVRYTLWCESGAEPSDADIAARMEQIRGRISGLVQADAGLTDPMGPAFRGRFATVLSPFCADSATDDKAVWERFCRNIASLVAPGGLMLTSSLRHCRRYRVGQRHFTAANIDEVDLQAILEKDFVPGSIAVEVRETPEHLAQGYSGIILARARRA
jgi:hypothetical protein